MKVILFAYLILFSMISYAKDFVMEDGIYYAYWATGDRNNYKVNLQVLGPPTKMNETFYFIRNLYENKGTNDDEVYLLVKDGRFLFFYKHDEIEGGPTVGWAYATLNNERFIIEQPIIENFYTHSKSYSDDSVKYEVGAIFSGTRGFPREKEIIPIEKISAEDYKVDCVSYFEENAKDKNISPIDHVMRDYREYVLLNHMGLCNLIIGARVSTKSYGWLLFRKVD